MALTQEVGWLEVQYWTKDLQSLLDGESEKDIEDCFGPRKIRRIKFALDVFLEKPHMVEKDLQKLIPILLSILLHFRSDKVITERLFEVLCMISNVIGFKNFRQNLTHEVPLFQQVGDWICEAESSGASWQSKYILMVWMSMVAVVPFDLHAMDDFDQALDFTKEFPEKGTLPRICAIAKKYLEAAGRLHEGAAEFFGRLMCRQDMADSLGSFCKWISGELNNRPPLYFSLGLLLSLVKLFCYGERGQMFPHASYVLTCALDFFRHDKSSSLQRHFAMKLIQRVGLTLLPPRRLSWRYQRKNHLLNFEKPTEEGSEEDDEEEDDDIPEEIESIIDILLVALSDRDTVVRWSAAKGIGRISHRLPKELADDIVDSLLSSFSIGTDEKGWNGACLALAEMARHGLLLPERIPSALKCVADALQYDKRQGGRSLGVQVRDAAAYVYWAFSRAYEPHILAPHVKEMAVELVVASLFDREVNCRRAANAAFQELVGRQSAVPSGIDIIQAANFFTLGSLSSCYTTLSIKIAKMDPIYKKAIHTHLLKVRIGHWDTKIRDATSLALSSFCETSDDWMASLSHLLPLTLSADTALRHGSVMGVAMVLRSLEKKEKKAWENDWKKFEDKTISVVGNLETLRKFNGKGAENVRHAACELIRSLCMIGAPLLSRYTPPEGAKASVGVRARLRGVEGVRGVGVEKTHFEMFFSVIDSSLRHIDEIVQASAVLAFEQMARVYGSSAQPFTSPQFWENFVGEITSLSVSPLAKRGRCQALGLIPPSLLDQSQLTAVLSLLTDCISNFNAAQFRDTETRQHAVYACVRIAENCLIEGEGEEDCRRELFQKIWKSLIISLEDYTIDRRGDVGSWVRCASLQGMERLFTLLSLKKLKGWITREMANDMACGFIVQSVSRLDRVRKISCEALSRVVHHKTPIPVSDNLTSLIETEKKREKTEEINDKASEKEERNEERDQKEEENEEGDACDAEFNFEEDGGETEEKEEDSGTDGLDFFDTFRGRGLLNAITRCANQKEKEEEEKLSIYHANAKTPKYAPPSFTLDTVVLFFVPLLRFNPFRKSVIQGCAMGAEGGGRYAMTTRVSLLQYIQQHASQKGEKFLDECFTILVDLIKDALDNRPQTPPQQPSPVSHQQPSQKTHLLSYFSTSVHFLSSSVFDCLQPPNSEVVPTLLKVCRDVVVTHSANLAFSKSVVKVVCGLIRFGKDEMRQKAQQLSMILLCHRFPLVRRCAAEELIILVSLFGHELISNFDDEKRDEIKKVLGETDWSLSLATVKTAREPLFGLLEIPKPVTVKKTNGPPPSSAPLPSPSPSVPKTPAPSPAPGSQSTSPSPVEAPETDCDEF